MLGIIPAYHGIYTEGIHTVKICEEDNIEFTPAEFTPVKDPWKGRQDKNRDLGCIKEGWGYVHTS